MTAPVRVAIVEDEPLARRTLRALIAPLDWLELVGEAADGASAVGLLNRLRPDLVFLDVRMPELSGLEVLERLAISPAVVFTTAYDRFALAAFELGAADYLLKPFGADRFDAAVARVRDRLRPAEPPSVLRDRLSTVDGSPLRRVFVRDAGTILPIRVENVSRFEAADDYVVVHAGGGSTHLISIPLAVLEDRLDPERFVRVHRSHIVNLDHVVALLPEERHLKVRLADGAVVIASRSGSRRLRSRRS